ncbi:glycosyl hydrolase [Flavihumibacter rivuli]|uniref:glycosyl hydrolase n=1 Tax=Flavihumibacter rivuli TaxID=2838156 RepID=UPI001BDF1674|nr:glycosyl hydrolase [Flavihumibacter rivuli]ULQ55337.1 glycosyl hydrolase [Flavihumibacter rivuli]
MKTFLGILLFMSIFFAHDSFSQFHTPSINTLKQGFASPPEEAKPGVYWYFLDGNMNREGMTKDLESMKAFGINHVIFLEVNLGVPKGKINFMSESWIGNFTYAIRECERLGIDVTLGVGPGWTGSGGPWVKAEESMLHLVSSEKKVTGGKKIREKLSVPEPKRPYFGEENLSTEVKKQWKEYYKDVKVLAFPLPQVEKRIPEIDSLALYYRSPYTSMVGVKAHLPRISGDINWPAGAVVDKRKIVDITANMQPDGTLEWTAPAGNWLIMRLGSRNNGAITRPAPDPGLGLESSKFDTTALNDHMANFVGKLINAIGPINPNKAGGLKRIHMDSWEMGAQNWSESFRQEFQKRRGYDPLPYFPVYAGWVVDNFDNSERFLWDLRLTAQELVIENHAQHLKRWGKRNKLDFSVEFYDMNPTADLELGKVGDIPMGEFWNREWPFNSSFSVIEATSIGHVNGIATVQAEAFTSYLDGWKDHPGSIKNQGDWAFAAGINRFFYHTFQHQHLDDSLKPAMSFGPHGVHWDRNQTWWHLSRPYHEYIARSQYLLQQGIPVADILYLTPEGAPHVFTPPFSALQGTAIMPDRKGFNFDGCAPSQLYGATVKDGRIVFPGGNSYSILVLPDAGYMSVTLLKKVEELVRDGAIVMGKPPATVPGLSDWKSQEKILKNLVNKIWGPHAVSANRTSASYGKGKLFWGGDYGKAADSSLYPSYNATAELLRSLQQKESFATGAPLRYIYRKAPEWDLYFVSNTTNQSIKTDVLFSATEGTPEIWHPVTAQSHPLNSFTRVNGGTSIPLSLEPYESYFIVFNKTQQAAGNKGQNFRSASIIQTLQGDWTVSFDPKWGGPGKVTFPDLTDWSLHPDPGIKYYSGTAFYSKTFDMADPAAGKGKKLILDLGDFQHLARVTLNGKDLGILWTKPYTLDITNHIKESGNELLIEVVNTWPNRLIGDEQLTDDGVKDAQWPQWILVSKPRPSRRYTFAVWKYYKKTDPLIPSGLYGPVTIKTVD